MLPYVVCVFGGGGGVGGRALTVYDTTTFQNVATIN